MSDEIKDQDQDTEGQGFRRAATEEDDTEGHRLVRATEEDDTEGHRLVRATEEDDTEGHNFSNVRRATEDDDVEGHGTTIR